MAQIKRKKVSNKAVKGQKREISLLKDKKFWIILSSIVGGIAVITLTVWLIIHFTTTTTVDNPDYFGGESDIKMSSELTKDNKVSFTKMSYEGVVMHTDLQGNANEAYVDYIFVYATDLSTFYADNKINSGKSSDDEGYVSDSTIEGYNKLFYQLLYLQYEIDNYNKTSGDVKVALYIVDTSIADNQSIFADSKFGGSDDNTSTSVFFLYQEDGLRLYADKEPNPKEVGQKKIYSTKNTEITQTCINNSVNLLKRNFTTE